MIETSQKNTINIWCPFPPTYLTDQLLFLKNIGRQSGLIFRISDKLNPSETNLFFEGISIHDLKVLAAFKTTFPETNVGIIATEYIEVIENNFHFYGKKIYQTDKYRNPLVSLSRLKRFLVCLDFADTIVILGDSPALSGLTDIFAGLKIVYTPFPKIEPANHARHTSTNSFYFSGKSTPYRNQVLNRLKNKGLLRCSTFFPMSEKQRKQRLRDCAFQINIPQDKHWKWVSGMRVYYGWINGKPSLSLGTNDQTIIATCIDQKKIDHEFNKCLVMTSPEKVFHEQIRNYHAKIAPHNLLVKSKWHRFLDGAV